MRISENGNHFRRRRFTRFLQLVDSLRISSRPVRILDLGGAIGYWEALRPLWQKYDFEITLINLDRADEDHLPHYRQRRGDACSLPQFRNNSFDVVHSNSVIEHVGSWSQMQAMASEVMRLAPHYFIQTPNICFPLEPHYRVPFMQFLPEYIQAGMLVSKRRGYVAQQATLSDAMKAVQGIRLLNAAQLKELFPDAKIYRERLLGLTKSIVAMR